uniref:Uncharacterized protein n=1 Tax=Oryza punctata TaxID=4537 RepID=A0A0E0JEU0_ORYPU
MLELASRDQRPAEKGDNSAIFGEHFATATVSQWEVDTCKPFDCRNRRPPWGTLLETAAELRIESPCGRNLRVSCIRPLCIRKPHDKIGKEEVKFNMLLRS